MNDHLLSLVLFTPLAGLLVLLFIPSRQKELIKVWANLASFAGFLISLPLVSRFDKGVSGFQFVERANWIPSLGAQYHLGIDGISFLLIMLTTVLGFLAVLSSWTAIQERVTEYYAMFLLLQVGMLGVFMSLDFFLFYVFWEVMLVPMYFIIGVWGGPRKLYAAIKFFLYTLTGSVLMLLGILTLYLNYTLPDGRHTFDLIELMKHTNAWPLQMQIWVFWAFFHGLCHQGSDVPVPHLAAGRACRGAYGRLGDPGGRAAEDGHLRLHPLLAPASAEASFDVTRPSCRCWRCFRSIGIAIVYGALVSA
jgi:NADH-quinone oxidoreductase subunit M